MFDQADFTNAIAEWIWVARIGFIVLGIVVLAFLVWDFFQKRRQKKPLPDQDKTEKTDISSKEAKCSVERDCWLTDAAHYWIYGSWEKPENGPVVLEEMAKYIEAFEEFAQAALDGKLKIWGKRDSESLWEPVSSDHWKDHWLDGYSVANRQNPEKMRTVQRIKVPARSRTYASLKTNKAQVEALWPAENT